MVLQECGFPRQVRVAELDWWRSYYPNPRPLSDLLEVVELTEVRNAQVRKLSGGQRRRLDFALALAGDPDLVFLDGADYWLRPGSPQAMLDGDREPAPGRARRSCSPRTTWMRRQPADRIAILRAGRIELVGTTHQVASGLAWLLVFPSPPPAALRRRNILLPDGIDLAVRGPESVCHTANAAMTLRLLLAWAVQHHLGDLAGLAATAPRLEDTYLQLTSTNGDHE